MVLRPSAPGRRPIIIAVVAVLVVLLAGSTALGVRAADRREAVAVAAQERAERQRDQAEQDQADIEDAERDAALQAERDAAALALTQLWSVSTADAAAQVTGAEALLAASEGEVADDTVRLFLAQALDAVRPLLGGDGAAPPGDVRAASTALTGALAGLGAASAAVTQARSQWQAEQEAAQEAARAAAAEAAGAAPRAGLGGPASPGAGPDCGGPASYEPPKNDGSPTFYTSTPTAGGDGSNGRVPASAMTRLGWCTDSQGNGQWLRTDAAAALTRLNEAFRAEFGENIAVDMSYRSYDDQVQMREYYGSAAARPGTSNHGLGLAFDTWEWAAYGFGSPRYEWLVANAPAHGWVAPTWARQNGANPEYWHFEYVG